MNLAKIVPLIFLIFLTSMTAAETQILKPTAHTDSEGQTTSPTNAYDGTGYDESTSAVTSEPRADPSITYSTWDTASKENYNDLNLSVTVSSSGYNDDTWAIYYDATTDTTCDSTDSVLKASGSENVGLRNYTVSLPANQNLADLQVCLTGAKNSRPDQGRSVSFYDIRTEGQYDGTPPKWRNQQQSDSILSDGQSVELSTQGKDNFELSGAVLSTNETGEWDNKSVYGSPTFPGTTDTWTWTNFTWQNSSMQTSTVSWKVWYNDSSGNYNVTDTESFEIDTEKPNVEVHSPVNSIYSSSDIDLEVSSNEQISEWRYNLDSNGNTTFEPNTTLTGLSDGFHSVDVWASDQAGNWNRTSVSFEVDTIPPDFSNRKEQPSDPINYRERDYQFNITVSDSNLDSVTFEFENVNYTPESSGNEYYVNLNSLPAGSYSYKWYANDTVGNTNTTQQYSYQVDKALTNTSLFLNGTEGNLQYEYNSTANLSVDLNASGEVELWDDLSGSLQRRTKGLPLLEKLLGLDYSLGSYTVKGVFFGNQNLTSDNQTQNLEIVDTTQPEPVSSSDNRENLVYKGQEIELRTLWDDNYELDSSILSVNSSGTLQNYSSKKISDWANFTYTVPTDSFPGTLGWKQYANDTSSNYGSTDIQTQEVWGYSSTETELNDTSVQVGEAVGASCRVRDSNSSTPISGYNVEIYNGTVIIDQGSTGDKGWFNTSFSLSDSQDNVPVKCAIYEDSSKKYSASSNSSVDLTVNQGNPPVLEDGIYNLNDTELTTGDSVKVYAKWNSSLDYSFIEYDNETSDNYIQDYSQSPFDNGWTNFTLETNENWFKGSHSAKIYANDTEGNLNNTLERLEFNVSGFSNVNYLEPEVEAERGNVELKAEVLDANTSERVSGHNLTFWNNGTKLGEVKTNSSGVAVYEWDTSNLEVGGKEVKVNITDSKFYTAIESESSGSFNLTGFLEPEIIEPSGIIHRGEIEPFSGEVYSDRGNTVTVGSADWLNSTNDLLTQSKTTSWNVPGDYPLGSETITFNVSKELYQYNSTSTEVEIYGFSAISGNTFTDSRINEGESSTYQCRIIADNTGNGISNYPVEFKNETASLGTSYTNSTGWVTKTFTDETPGKETYECSISDNSTLKFNASSPSSATAELETVDTTPPEFTVESPSDGDSFPKAEVQWINTTWADNFNLSTAVFSLNDSGSFRNTTIDLTGTEDSADYSFTNTSFEGLLGYRVYGNDTYGNFNSTSTRTAKIYGESELSSIESSSGTVSPGSNVDITCKVRDQLTQESLSDYQVNFYNGTTQINSSTTNSVGEVKFNYSQGFAGDANLKCRISDDSSKNYQAVGTELSETVTFQFGNQDAILSGINAIGGRLEGTENQLESADEDTLGWLDVENTTQQRSKLLEVNSTTNIPPGTLQSLNFQWNLSRSVENYAEQVNDPGGTGTLTLSNGDINATWFTDPDYAELTEGGSGNSQILERKGFYYYLPESLSETSISKIRFNAEINSINNEGESVSVDFFDYTNSNYVSCTDYSGTDWSNQSCEITDPTTISNIVNGDEVSIEFTDTLDQKNELQSSWRVRNAQVEAFYENPATGNTFKYELGAENQSSGNLQRVDGTDINGTLGFTEAISQKPKDYLTPDGRLKGYLSFNTTNNAFTDSYRIHNFDIDKYNTQLNYDVARVKDLEIETENSSGQGIEDVKYEVYGSGQLIDNFSSTGGKFTDKLEEGKKYNLKQSIPDGSDQFNVTYRNFSLSESFNMRTRLVNYSDLTSANSVDNVSKIYAADGTGFDFDNATLKVPKGNTAPDVILHCKDYDFDSNDCGNWEVDQISEYQTREDQNYFYFNVSSFSAFGTGNGEPLPNIKEVRIYNVSGQQNLRTGGDLLASGLNETFRIDQYDSETKYRFDFKIQNEGNKDWTLEPGDEMRHRGLNETWQREDSFYNISGTVYGGGTKTGDTLNWDTSNGGTLPRGENMTSSYVVNTSTVSSNFYEMDFLVNDTNNNAGSQDFHKLNKTKYGFLDLNLNTPPTSFSAQQNSTFTVNSTLECKEGICGEANISVRYNETDVTDTLVPTSESEPFYIIGSDNTKQCGKLDNGKGCTETWEVNATGSKGSTHLLDTNSTSSYPEVNQNSSQESKISIVESLVMEIDWDAVDFGAVKPGEQNYSARGNFDLKYNVTIPQSSKSASKINISGETLNNSRADNYFINISNIGYSLQNDTSEKDQLSEKPEILKEDVGSGTTLNTFYWINVPDGLKSGKYSGVINFEAIE